MEVWLNDVTQHIFTFLTITDCLCLIITCSYFYNKKEEYFITLKYLLEHEQDVEQKLIYKDSEGRYVNLDFCVYLQELYTTTQKEYYILSNVMSTSLFVPKPSDLIFNYKNITGFVVVETPWNLNDSNITDKNIYYIWYYWAAQHNHKPIYCLLTIRPIITWIDISNYISLPQLVKIAQHFVTIMDTKITNYTSNVIIYN